MHFVEVWIILSKLELYKLDYVNYLSYGMLGYTALDLAKDAQMQQVLCVKPVRQLQKTATRFDSQLLRRYRFLGWKPVWVRPKYVQ